MKKYLIFFIVILCAIGEIHSQTYISMRPSWTFNPPKAENETYEYYVSKGVGETEKAARADAYIIAVKEAQSRIGVGSQSTEIFNAFQNSDQSFNVTADYYEIPMKEVCSFSEKSRDGKSYYYYQLLQVAISGNIKPNFRQFTGDCYDFSKAKELREIMKEEYKEKIEEDQKRQEQEAKTQRQEERKSKRLDNPYCNSGKHRYVAWNIAGTGYPCQLIDGIEFRYGKIVGFGAFFDVGMDFEPAGNRNGHYYYTETYFHYSGGLKFYFFRGLFLDAGWGTSTNAYDGGLIFHAGYNFVTNPDRETGKVRFFLGLSAGALFDVWSYTLEPSINLKLGIAFGIK